VWGGGGGGGRSGEGFLGVVVGVLVGGVGEGAKICLIGGDGSGRLVFFVFLVVWGRGGGGGVLGFRGVGGANG